MTKIYGYPAEVGALFTTVSSIRVSRVSRVGRVSRVSRVRVTLDKISSLILVNSYSMRSAAVA